MSVILLMLGVLAGNVFDCSANTGYRGIVPLKSTRADVVRLLGHPTDRESQRYVFRHEIVTVSYSKYGCQQPPQAEGWPTPPLEGWNVPPDTVLVVSVTLRKQVPLASLGFDLERFKRVRGDSDVASHFRYTDEEMGFTIDLNGDGDTDIVRGYFYQPAREYDRMRCAVGEPKPRVNG